MVYRLLIADPPSTTRGRLRPLPPSTAPITAKQEPQLFLLKNAPLTSFRPASALVPRRASTGVKTGLSARKAAMGGLKATVTGGFEARLLAYKQEEAARGRGDLVVDATAHGNSSSNSNNSNSSGGGGFFATVRACIQALLKPFKALAAYVARLFGRRGASSSSTRTSTTSNNGLAAALALFERVMGELQQQRLNATAAVIQKMADAEQQHQHQQGDVGVLEDVDVARSNNNSNNKKPTEMAAALDLFDEVNGQDEQEAALEQDKAAPLSPPSAPSQQHQHRGHRRANVTPLLALIFCAMAAFACVVTLATVLVRACVCACVRMWMCVL